MSSNQASFPIAGMARVLGVSQAGRHAWHGSLPSTQARADAAPPKRVLTVHASSQETYGAPRIHTAMRLKDQRHGCERIARLTRLAGLVGASGRGGGVVTARR